MARKPRYCWIWLILFLCSCATPIALEQTGAEFDANSDGYFDAAYKVDVDNLGDGGAALSAPALAMLKASSYAAMRAALDLEAGTDFYSVAATDAAITAIIDDTPANGSIVTAPSANWAYDHSANAAVHNSSCVAGDGNCAEVSTGNTTTYSRTINAGECHRWQEYSAGSWVWYRQCYGESSATEERQGYVDETGNYVFTGQIDYSGEITVPTQSASDSSSNAASTSFVQAAIALALGAAGVDTVPAAFSFTDVADGNVTTEYDDNVTITGIDSTTTISIAGDGGEYQINAGARTAAAGTVALNDVVTVYLTSSGLNSTAVNTTLNVGGVTDTFTITTVAGGGSVCTGDVVFDWPMTADFLSSYDISTSGGCTVGDATILLESAAAGETAPAGRTNYALYIPGAYDVASFDISSYDIWDYAAGTITFDVYITTWANSGWLFSTVGEASQDQLLVMLYDGDDIRVEYEGANAGPVRATTAAAGLAINTWYSVTVKWRTGATDPSIEVTVNGVTAQSTTDLTAFDTAPTELNIGNAGGTVPAYYIKNFRIYSTWQ